MKAARRTTLLSLTLAALLALGGVLTGCGGEQESEGSQAHTEPSSEGVGSEGVGAAPEGSGEAAGEQGGGEEGAANAGPVVNDPTFELRANAGGPYSAGQNGSFEIRLTPRGGYHVNQEFPTTINLSGPEAIAFADSELEGTDAAEMAEQRARFNVAFTPSAAGEHRVTARVSFAVCTPENCMPDERTLALVLPVQ
jgi:hypothetical protein